MTKRWTYFEDKILQPHCCSAGSETDLGQMGMDDLRYEGYHRTECAVRHRIRWLRKQSGWNILYKGFGREESNVGMG